MPFGPDLNAQPLRHLDGILLPDEVHVWHVLLEAWQKEVDSLGELLDAAERERAARFKFRAPRDQYVISRSLLRQALGRYLDIDPGEVCFAATANGKPALAGDSDLQFNLSHTEGATVLAIARNHRVGIDVERIQQNTDALELAARFFSPREVLWLRSQPVSEHIPSFFSCWTAKEAYIKAHGQGLSMPLAGFSVLPGPEGGRLELKVDHDRDESSRWSMWRLDLEPDLRAALAVEGEPVSLRLGRWPQPEADH